MRYLGIDYGEKRVGVALSDERGEFAMPYGVLPNNKKLVSTIGNICQKEGVSEIILGESKDYKGVENVIMKKVHLFKYELEEKLKMPVYFELEFMTSAEATHIQGEVAKLDASAAALILKSYLDKKTNG